MRSNTILTEHKTTLEITTFLARDYRTNKKFVKIHDAKPDLTKGRYRKLRFLRYEWKPRSEPLEEYVATALNLVFRLYNTLV